MAPVDQVAFQAARRPSATAAIDLTTGGVWTYAALDEAIARCAGLLRDHYGCLSGDRVASLAKNRVDLVILHHACARADLIYTPLNWRLSSREVSDLIADAEPRLLIGDTELQRLGVDGVALEAFMAQTKAAAPLPRTPIPSGRISLILFTSGTSGRPKGVMLSEGALAETAINFGLLGDVQSNSAILIDTPMFHVIGLVTSVRPAFMAGGTILVSDGFEPARTLARLGDPALRATHYFCVPQMADRLRAEPGFDARALSSLTALFTGGAPHPETSIRAWLAAGVAVADGFGMSEAGTVLGMPVDAAQIDRKAGAVGLPTPRVELRIVGPNDQTVGQGEAGELLLKGANLFSGYWRRPEETAAAFTPDGWFRTGDIAVKDADGFFTIVDRKKDMFISGGENVYPAEIEAALADFPGLVECAVLGVPDDRWGEVGLCVLVHPSPSEDLFDAVKQHLADRLASYKTPRRFMLIDRLPRTGSGKIQKAELRLKALASAG